MLHYMWQINDDDDDDLMISHIYLSLQLWQQENMIYREITRGYWLMSQKIFYCKLNSEIILGKNACSINNSKYFHNTDQNYETAHYL